MALADIVNRTRGILYGTGLNEKPALRIALADAGEVIAGQLVTFDLVASEGAKIAPGHVLSVYDPDTEGDAHAVYVTSISTDEVTGINSYLGSPAVADTDLDGAILEQNPFVTGFEIFEAIDAIMAHYLYPDVYDITTATIASPDQVDGQEAVPTAALEILSAHQFFGPTAIPVGFTRYPEDVHTDIASTGRLSDFDWVNATTGYYTYKEKFAEADEATDELTHLIAVGSAALLLGAHLTETSLSATKADNAQAAGQRQQIANTLWRDFLTLRQQIAETLTRQGNQNTIRVNRG